MYLTSDKTTCSGKAGVSKSTSFPQNNWSVVNLVVNDRWSRNIPRIGKLKMQKIMLILILSAKWCNRQSGIFPTTKIMNNRQLLLKMVKTTITDYEKCISVAKKISMNKYRYEEYWWWILNHLQTTDNEKSSSKYWRWIFIFNLLMTRNTHRLPASSTVSWYFTHLNKDQFISSAFICAF